MNSSIILCLFLWISLFACQQPIVDNNPSIIRINQIGFYPPSVKQFTVVDMDAKTFEIVDKEDKVVYSGELKDNGKWDKSGEMILMGDFSSLQKEGKYHVIVDGKISSYPFKIKKDLYKEAFHAAIKSYYFQRASMSIDKEYGGIYARNSGHPDDKCNYHPSTGKASGSLRSPRGWYDAGDYGKYVCNASLSVGQMLLLLEQYPEAIEDGDLNIPESGNKISDLWDELMYELNWIISMQDIDGGVFHKLTALGFGGFIMPEEYDLERRIIGKGTAATLNYAAVIAQASRLYKNIDPKWSSKALNRSKKAWNWAIANPKVAYSNPEDVSTGAYDDDVFSDDFYWAATELFLATNEAKYLEYINDNPEEYQHQLTNSWKFFIRNNGFHSLLENRDLLSNEMAQKLSANHLKLANDILNRINEHPYRISLDRYEWGSNSDILNQAMILCVAHKLSGEEKYLIGAEQITDYIFGKNATSYCFMTGFGSKQIMFPHHRPSGADGIDLPVPGFILGGPNDHRQDNSQVAYESEYPAKAFMDVEESFASNEVCINWNAPAVYVLGYLQQVRK